jgi:homeobox protein cut-like
MEDAAVAMLSPAATSPAQSKSTAVPAAASESALSPPGQSLVDAWTVFDLSYRRAALDEEGLRIAQRQDASAESRKGLAASTRTFKRAKLPADASPAAFASLLKEYQAEVDSLTSRSKAAEAAFLGIYKALYEVPDPLPDLNAAVADRAEVARLNEKLRADRKDNIALTERAAAATKLESRIAELETANTALAARVAEEAKAQVELKQQQWAAAQVKAIEAYELREQELLHQLSVANAALHAQQASADTLKQQHNDTLAQIDQLKNARAAGAEMVAEDGERARAEVADLRRQVQLLQESGAGGASGDVARTSLGRSALSAELAARDVEVSQLKDQVNALEEVLSDKDAEKSSEYSRIAASIKAKDTEIASLAATVAALPSLAEYKTMKRQFETLQRFQLNDLEDADSVSVISSDPAGTDDPSTAPSNAAASSRLPVIALERRLLAKVKTMESKMTAMRVELSGKDSRMLELFSLVRSLEERNDDQKRLIAKLEEGINAISTSRGTSSRAPARLEGDHGPISLSVPANTDGGDSLVGDDSQSSTWDWGEQQQAISLQRIIRHSADEPTMLDIVSGQRDRFRTRTVEVEDDNRKLVERLEKATADLDRMKSDNVKLYEKIRFLQSYNTQAIGGGASTRMGGGSKFQSSASAASSGSIVIGVDDEESGSGILGQYRSLYEEASNPFNQFNRRERHKRLNDMSAPERVTMRASQRAMNSKTSRIVVFCYILALHVLVFLVTMSMASGTTHCPELDVAAHA